MNIFITIAVPILLGQFLNQNVQATENNDGHMSSLSDALKHVEHFGDLNEPEIYYKQLQNWANGLLSLKEPVTTFKAEFKALPNQTGTGSAYATAFKNEKNIQKNRYPNSVYLLEESRVLLKYDQYIHASHISMHANKDDKKIICTQAPIMNSRTRTDTRGDFWQMIVEYNIDAILMITVTDTFSGKCAQYWPKTDDEKIQEDKEKKMRAGAYYYTCGLDTCGPNSLAPMVEELSFDNPSGKYTIKNIKEENLKYNNVKIEKTKLEVEYIPAEQNVEETHIVKGSKLHKKKVVHFQWKDWPDHGTPNDFIAPILLWDALKEYKNVVVHCTAGIGRTGTMVAIELGQQLMRNGVPLNIYKLVEDLRNQRAHSVENVTQYLYIYKVFLNLAKLKAANEIVKLNKENMDKLIHELKLKAAKEKIEKMDKLINEITEEINHPIQEEDPLDNIINKKMDNFQFDMSKSKLSKKRPYEISNPSRNIPVNKKMNLHLDIPKSNLFQNTLS